MGQQQRKDWKKNIQFPRELQKLRPSTYLVQLPILKGGLGILDV